MGRYGDLNYAMLTKRGFSLGVGLFLFGVLGELTGAVVLGHALSSLQNTLLVDMEALGILVGMLSVFGFGIVLPLTE